MASSISRSSSSGHCKCSSISKSLFPICPLHQGSGKPFPGASHVTLGPFNPSTCLFIYSTYLSPKQSMCSRTHIPSALSISGPVLLSLLSCKDFEHLECLRQVFLLASKLREHQSPWTQSWLPQDLSVPRDGAWVAILKENKWPAVLLWNFP